MDRLTPIELERIQLPKRLRGYDTHTVERLLNRAATDIETLTTELREVRQNAEFAARELERYKSQEENLQEALKLAQRTAEETRATAHREAELLRERAERDAMELRQKLGDEISREKWELERLRSVRRRYFRELKNLLQGHLEELGEAGQQAELPLDSAEVTSDIALAEKKAMTG